MKTYTKFYDYLKLPLTDKTLKVLQDNKVSQLSMMFVLSHLIRQYELCGSNTFEITTSSLIKYTNLTKNTVNRSLDALRTLNFIIWDNTGLKTARRITINTELLDKMAEKWNKSNACEEDKIQDVQTDNNRDNLDIIMRIVSFFKEKGTTVDIDYVDEIRDTICGGDEDVRRSCTRKAKDYIKEHKLM